VPCTAAGPAGARYESNRRHCVETPTPSPSEIFFKLYGETNSSPGPIETKLSNPPPANNKAPTPSPAISGDGAKSLPLFGLT
jgi:hypothetical protein